MSRDLLYFGAVPVPYTASWTAEQRIYVDRCKFADNRLSICQESARGHGKPQFGTPHMIRQREVMALNLCDLCAKPLKNRTKVSLSHARSQIHAANTFDVLQVEPLLHRECAAISVRHCPALKRDIKEGRIEVRQVMRHLTQLAIYSEQGVFEATGQRVQAISHAKVQLIQWVDRDADWLDR